MISEEGGAISDDISKYYESICYANTVKENKNEKLGLVVKRSNAWDTLHQRQKQVCRFQTSGWNGHLNHQSNEMSQNSQGVSKRDEGDGRRFDNHGGNR